MGLEVFSLEDLLTQAQTQECSDIHLGIGQVPYLRIKGRLESSQYPIIDELTFWHWLETVFTADEIEQIKFGVSVVRVVNYPFGNVSIRGCLTLQGVVMTVRFIAQKIPAFAQLGIPSALTMTCHDTQGLIIISGVVGSGKMTTLGSLINYVNQEMIRKIYIIEDEVSFIYETHQSLIQNLLVGIHIPNIIEGVKIALKSDSDIIVVNGFIDRATFDILLEAARCGNLVFLCTHSASAIATIQELYTLYSHQEQDFIRLRLADTLKAVMSQRLVPTLTGNYKRSLIFDLLLKTNAVRNALAHGNIHELSKLMQQSQELGMSTMEEQLENLLESKRISQETFTETWEKICKSDFQNNCSLLPEGYADKRK